MSFLMVPYLASKSLMDSYRSKMAGLWRSYSKLVERFPWGTNILQTGVLCATGDVIAQFAVERRRLEVNKVE